MIKTTSSVNIKATTWSKNSQGLFDYESSLISEKTLEALSSTKILRTDDDVLLDSDISKNQADFTHTAQPLVCLKQHKDSFVVCPNPQAPVDDQNKQDNIWQVVKTVNPSDLSYRGYVLSEGDVIKLGKIKLRVRELKSFYNPATDPSYYSFVSQNEQINMQKPDEVQVSKRKISDFIQTCNVHKLPQGDEFTCRICLEGQDNDKNPLITPCNCSGSVSHIHLECLKQWMESKCFRKDYQCSTIYMWKDLECEICHQILPDVFLQDGKEIELLNIVRPTETYLILETLPEKKQIKKVFYVATFTKDNKANLLKVGRKGDCEIKVNDISVSRLHAMLRHFDGVFYLENGFSKFGTLVLFQKEFELSKKHGVVLQIGKTVLNFELKTTEVVVPHELEEQKLNEQIMNISSESEPEKKVEEEFKWSNYPRAGEDSLFRKISDASTEMIFTGIESARLSVSDFSYLPEDQGPGSASSAGVPLIDSNQIKSDLEHLDKLMGSIRELIEDRSKIMAEIEKNSVPLNNRTDFSWNSFEPYFSQNSGSTNC